MSPTIPLLCIPALGDMLPSDPYAAVTDGESVWGVHPLCSSTGLFDEERADRVLVEQSEGALLRVLSRHLGWEGNHRPVMRIERRGHSNTRPVWVLRNLTKWHDAPMLDDGPNFYTVLLEHISTDLDYLEALAEAVIWHARVARIAAWAATAPGEAADIRRWCTKACAGQPDESTHVAYAEGYLGLPAWAVQ